MVAQQQLAPQVMKGGSHAYMADLAKKFSQPIQVYVLLALILAITFVKEIPVVIRSNANTFLGRLVLFAITIGITHFYSWSNGLLMAVLTLLLLSMSPRKLQKEGFAQTQTLKLIGDKERWFVEKALKENPIGIEEEQVSTQAIQDSSNSSRSTVAQGTSNK